jgi:transposase
MILAIDLGKFNSVACWYDADRREEKFQTARTTQEEMRQLLLAHPVDVVVFEACTVAGWVYDLCGELGLKAHVANPNGEAWKWKNVKRKTDRDDALKLARLQAMGELPLVHIPTQTTRQKRSLLHYRQSLVSQRVAVQNRIRALLCSQGLPAPRGHRAWTKLGREGMSQLARPLAECAAEELWRGQLALSLTHLQQIEELIDQVEKKLDAFGQADANVQTLQAIPGVGARTAEVVASYLDNPKRFRKGSQVSSFAGLVPRQYQSGETDRRGRINKRGPGLLRQVLVECAWVMLRYNAWAQRLVQRISRGQRTRKKQAVVALARKLLVRCWAMLRDGKPWQDPCTSSADGVVPTITVVST